MSLKLTYSSNSREPVPPGTHKAVLVDVVDLGIQETQFGEKPMCRLTFEVEKTHPESGKRLTISKWNTATLAPKSNLYADVKAMIDRDLEEGEDFDVESMIGISRLIAVTHVERNGSTFDNITSIAPLLDDMEPLKPSPDYVREKDKPGGKDVRSPKSGDSPDDFQREAA